MRNTLRGLHAHDVTKVQMKAYTSQAKCQCAQQVMQLQRKKINTATKDTPTQAVGGAITTIPERPLKQHSNSCIVPAPVVFGP